MKRKPSIRREEQPDMCQSRKGSHNAIEKRYRINLNDKIAALRQSIPTLRGMPNQLIEVDEEDRVQDSRQV